MCFALLYTRFTFGREIDRSPRRSGVRGHRRARARTRHCGRQIYPLGTPLSVEPVAGTSTGRLRATALRNMLWRIYLLAFAPCLRTQELGPYPPPPSDTFE